MFRPFIAATYFITSNFSFTFTFSLYSLGKPTLFHDRLFSYDDKDNSNDNDDNDNDNAAAADGGAVVVVKVRWWPSKYDKNGDITFEALRV
ncbi:Hypothetical predicted protein [Octopus vulgaris]|uniref:Uncharacterized protein n=1 Tax=Octopus vulgaris TaxID=6645 RepID=A0AA36AYI7_OCTVU|nr:Hypothetical predicted protein [Octopus vulgaris]